MALALASCSSVPGNHLTYVKDVGMANRDDRTLIDESFQGTWYTIKQTAKNSRPQENFGKGVKIIDNMVTYFDGRLDLVDLVYYTRNEKGILFNMVQFYERNYIWTISRNNDILTIKNSEGAIITLTNKKPRE